MEKPKLDTLEKEPRSQETNDQQEIAESVDVYPETGGVSLNEAKKQEGEMKIAEVKKEIRTKFDTAPAKTVTEAETSVMQMEVTNLPPNTPEIFNRMPEISKFVTEYMENYNKRNEAKGLKKLWNKLSSDADELKKFEDAGKKAMSRDFKSHYLRALEKKQAGGAWNYVKTLIDHKYAGVDENGDVQLNGVFRVAMGEESALKGGQ